MQINISPSAVISDCGLYRYRLDRPANVNGVGKVVAYFGINPSKADGTLEDATTRKWREFTRRHNGSRYIAANVFAYRSTDVKELNNVVDALGPLNNEHIKAVIKEADLLVPCWGNSSKVPPRLRHHIQNLLQTLLDSGKPVRVWGFTQSGDPKHPLMLGYKTPLVDYWKALQAHAVLPGVTTKPPGAGSRAAESQSGKLFS